MLHTIMAFFDFVYNTMPVTIKPGQRFIICNNGGIALSWRGDCRALTEAHHLQMFKFEYIPKLDRHSIRKAIRIYERARRQHTHIDRELS